MSSKSSSSPPTVAPTVTAASNKDNFLSSGLLLKAVVWVVGWYLSVQLEFGAVYFCTTSIYCLFASLSSSTNETEATSPHAKNTKNAAGNKLSAYSVFNKGGKRIAGSIDPEQLDKQLRNNTNTKSSVEFTDVLDGDEIAQEHYKRKSKFANRPCVCGSGRKYKHCCSPQTRNSKQEEEEWKKYEAEWT